MNVPLEYEVWIDLLEQLMNTRGDLLKWMVFTVFDFNDDKAVCYLDMFAIMKLYENDDQVFVSSYAYDFCKLVTAIHSK
jgi:hypothetical protein